MILTGRLDGADVAGWILHRARRLSLSGRLTEVTESRVTLTVKGPAPLLDALHVACLLGPAQVQVEGIERVALSPAGFAAAMSALGRRF
ncbi:hypothetical protein [Mesobacterium pallidum]|uniref:hypothetical protein n=1 Tax=Mesobacterium pallidum TaxID=2872037 RepID=UPI001EE19461|nr:hypothetical protein [Mesobacterium pallidum]